MLFVGGNLHHWKDWALGLAAIKQGAAPVTGAVRWDEYTETSLVADVVAHTAEVAGMGLHPLIVLIPPVSPLPPVTVFADYLTNLVPALVVAGLIGGPFEVMVEIGNEPNGQISGFWSPPIYAAALQAAWNASGPLKIISAGLAVNDQSYLAQMGPISKVCDGVAMHPYTDGGNPHVGPFAPDDLDTAHNGRYSFLQCILQTQARFPGKPLYLTEFGWTVPSGMSEFQRCAYFRAAVSIASAHGVAGLYATVFSLGDTPAGATSSANLIGTPSAAAMFETARICK